MAIRSLVQLHPLILLHPVLFVFLVLLVIWDGVWKGLGMWRAGRNNQLVWFIVILIFNTAGILPIIYLLAFQKNRNPRREEIRKVKVVRRR